jgi:hypothetical protein
MEQIMLNQLKSLLRLTAVPQHNLTDADSFILLGFGLAQTADGQDAPGKSNQAIARWLVAHNSQKRITFTQEGTYLALKEMEAENPGLAVDEWTINLPHDEHVHVDTYGAALQIWILARELGVERPCLVTHPWQMARARRIFQKLPWINQLIVPKLTLAQIPFDPQSTQIWTRHPLLYLCFEYFMARPIGFLFGWLR